MSASASAKLPAPVSRLTRTPVEEKGSPENMTVSTPEPPSQKSAPTPPAIKETWY